jgi:hypothetical protein
MGSFDWLELDTLTRDIEHTQGRLDAARATSNYGLITLLERQIAEASERRSRVLADITKALGGSTSVKPYLRPIVVREAQLVHAGGEPSAVRQVEEEPQRAAKVEPGTTGTVGLAKSPGLSIKEGVPVMWDRLTAADIEQAKRSVTNRRSEMLARHAEELKALDAEQTEISAIEQAINAFARKFKIGGAEVVPFDGERGLHTQAG